MVRVECNINGVLIMGNFLHLSVICISLTGCVRDVVLDAGERPKVVVECVLTDSSPQELRLSFTKGASLAEVPELTEASARLIDLTNNYPAGEFRRRDDGIWVLDYAAEPRHNYRLEVEVPEYELVWAEQTMPVENDIYCSSYAPYAASSTLPSYKNLVGTEYSYHKLRYNTWIYGMNYDEQTGIHRMAELICTDCELVDNFNLTGDAYIPETSDTDFYGRELPSELYPYLSGAGLHRNYLRLKKSDSEEGPFLISGDFRGPYYYYLNRFPDKPREPYENDGYIVFMTVSDDYDRYLKEAIGYISRMESSDVTAAFRRENIFTNIHGGVGIFGAQIKGIGQWMRAFYDMNSEPPFSQE